MRRWLNRGHAAALLAASTTMAACGGGGGYAPAFTPAPPAPDLAVSVGGSLDMLPNQENTILVTVQSLGAIAATGAVLTVPTPAGFTYEAAWCTSATGGATCPASTTAQALTAGLTLPSVPPHGVLKFTLDGVTSPTAGPFVEFTATVNVVGDAVPVTNAALLRSAVVMPAASTLVASVPAPTYPGGSPELEAFNWINAERARCGLGLLKQDARIDLASTDHATYLATNLDSGNINQVAHQQNPAFPAYTGLDATARAQVRGYSGPASDLLAQESTALLGYKIAFGYTSYQSLSAQGGAKDLGLASTKPSSSSAFVSVINVGVPAPSGSTSTQLLEAQQQIAGDVVATYPCGGEVLIRRNHGQEDPSPLPNTDLSTKGPPITIFVRAGQTFRLKEVLLTTASGTVIGGHFLRNEDRPQNLTPSQAVFIPAAPLPANTTFNFLVSGTNDWQRFEKRITFSTGD